MTNALPAGSSVGRGSAGSDSTGRGAPGRDTEGMRGEKGKDLDFQNKQNAHEQPGLLGPYRQYLREAFVEVIKSNPLPPDRITPISSQVNKHFPYLLRSLGKMSQPPTPHPHPPPPPHPALPTLSPRPLVFW